MRLDRVKGRALKTEGGDTPWTIRRGRASNRHSGPTILSRPRSKHGAPLGLCRLDGAEGRLIATACFNGPGYQNLPLLR
jgi:hypothetical protein